MKKEYSFEDTIHNRIQLQKKFGDPVVESPSRNYLRLEVNTSGNGLVLTQSGSWGTYSSMTVPPLSPISLLEEIWIGKKEIVFDYEERELPDDYPVYWDYVYVADGVPIRSDIIGKVVQLKSDLTKRGISCTTITNYNWERRREYERLKRNK